jgi:hypothetical protein
MVDYKNRRYNETSGGMMSCCEYEENLERMYDYESDNYYLVCKECGNFIKWVYED